MDESATQQFHRLENSPVSNSRFCSGIQLGLDFLQPLRFFHVLYLRPGSTAKKKQTTKNVIFNLFLSIGAIFFVFLIQNY